MNFLLVLLFSFIIILFPLLTYLFFVAYNKNIDSKLNKFYFGLALITIYYLQIKYLQINYDSSVIIITFIPLLIAIIKDDKISISILMIIHILTLYIIYKYNIYSLLILHLIIIIISLVRKNKLFPFIYFSIISIFLFIELRYNILLLIFNYLVINILYLFIDIFLKKGDKIINYHMSLKEIEQEKQIQQSLFKIAHEIKNPLAVCKGYFDMLDLNNKKHIEKYIPVIKEEIEHSLLILQDFLSITKIKVEKDIMDINMLVEEVNDNFKPLFKNKKIHNNIKLIDDEVYINGDYNRLKQVLINIVKNSIEALNKENSKINIMTMKNNKYFQIIVEDNGVGMDEEVIKHFSEPFYTTKQNGTGLGITLSKEILKEHNATITYKSEKMIGTKVLINIPLN